MTPIPTALSGGSHVILPVVVHLPFVALVTFSVHRHRDIFEIFRDIFTFSGGIDDARVDR